MDQGLSQRGSDQYDNTQGGGNQYDNSQSGGQYDNSSSTDYDNSSSGQGGGPSSGLKGGASAVAAKHEEGRGGELFGNEFQNTAREGTVEHKLQDELERNARKAGTHAAGFGTHGTTGLADGAQPGSGSMSGGQGYSSGNTGYSAGGMGGTGAGYSTQTSDSYTSGGQGYSSGTAGVGGMGATTGTGLVSGGAPGYKSGQGAGAGYSTNQTGDSYVSSGTGQQDVYSQGRQAQMADRSYDNTGATAVGTGGQGYTSGLSGGQTDSYLTNQSGAGGLSQGGTSQGGMMGRGEGLADREYDQTSSSTTGGSHKLQNELSQRAGQR